MKKIIAIVLILLTISTAASGESFAGCWAIWIPNSSTYGSGNLCLFLELNEDGTMALMSTTNSPSDHTINEISGTGTWEQAENAVKLTSEDSVEKLTLEYRDGLLWFIVGSMRCGLRKIQDFTSDQLVYIGDK